MTRRRALSIKDFPLTTLELDRWDGWCLELVNELLGSHPTGQILWIDNPIPRWKYHAALVLDGLVYDAWYPHAVLPPADYITTVFGECVDWEIIGHVEEGE